MTARITEILDIAHPLVQAPMAGAQDWRMAAAVANAGGLGSIPCAMLSVEQIEEQVEAFRNASNGSLNLNFFCHEPEEPTPGREAGWRQLLKPYYEAYGLDDGTPSSGQARSPFVAEHAELVERLAPAVVSFHFGLPGDDLLERVKAAGSAVIASATSLEEGLWLQQKGIHAVIAQGVEAGGHRGMFIETDIANQIGTFALVQVLAGNLDIPVIAAGGIADPKAARAAMILGAEAVQVGTAFLFSSEAMISPLHREALKDRKNHRTALTNLFSGKPARSIVTRLMEELGPMSGKTPPFPTAGVALAPLKKHAETLGAIDFSSTWSGQGAPVTAGWLEQTGGKGDPIGSAEIASAFIAETGLAN